MMTGISDTATIRQLQEMLSPIGENLYALIVSNQDKEVDRIELHKRLNSI